MYVTGKNRYDNYTSRYDVYLFTLRDYTEVLLDKFKGRYLERSDMPVHSGYLLEFVDTDSAKQFIAGIATKSDNVKEFVTAYELPHLEGNELPLYATIADGIDIVYIGLSKYPEVLDKYLKNIEKFTVSFNKGDGTGEMQDVAVVGGSTYTVPNSTFTAPGSKHFNNWIDKDNNLYVVGDKIKITGDINLTAQYV